MAAQGDTQIRGEDYQKLKVWKDLVGAPTFSQLHTRVSRYTDTNSQASLRALSGLLATTHGFCLSTCCLSTCCLPTTLCTSFKLGRQEPDRFKCPERIWHAMQVQPMLRQLQSYKFDCCTFWLVVKHASLLHLNHLYLLHTSLSTDTCHKAGRANQVYVLSVSLSLFRQIVFAVVVLFNTSR